MKLSDYNNLERHNSATSYPQNISNQGSTQNVSQQQKIFQRNSSLAGENKEDNA